MNGSSSIHNRRSILERMYVQQVLKEEGTRMRNEHIDRISALLTSRSGRLKEGPSIKVQSEGIAGGSLEMTHLKYQRFLDIRKRMSNGKNRKFPIHNKVIFGHLSDILRRLMYGFTEEIQSKLEQENNTIDL